MYQFDYYRAQSIQDVCGILGDLKSEGRIIAGGTDLMVQIRDRDARWKCVKTVVDITSLGNDLRYIRDCGGYIRIGALCTHTDLENSSLIKENLPFVGTACGMVGSPQIRNRGTIGGSICNASPASDPLPPLIAADTFVEITGTQGSRLVSIPDFYSSNGKTILKYGEFVTALIINKFRNNTSCSFIKLGRRKALAISRLNVAVTLHTDENGRIDDAAVSPGCVFRKPRRIAPAEKMLAGSKPSEKVFHAAGIIVSDEVIRETGIRWSTEYKKPVIAELVTEALCEAAKIEMRNL